MDEVTYICKRTVVSAKPVQPGKYCRLSVLDRLMEQNQLKVVYYYGTQSGRTGEITSKLRESMSEILTCFPIMNGRLVRDPDGQWMIKCNDAGVRMVEGRAKGCVHDWLKTVDREKELKLVHWEDMYQNPYFWSTFYVQITEFEEGGLAIGLSCTHLLADPRSAATFIQAWTDTTLDGKMITPPFFHPLPPRRPGNKNPNHIPYTNLINYYKSIFHRNNLVTDANNYATIVLSFSGPMVHAIMTKARTSGAPNQPNPSPFESLSALFWVCLSKIKGSKDKLVDMSICLNMRKVLGLDKGFFGNCMVYNKVEIESSNSLANASKAIGEVITKMDNEGVMDLIEWLQYNDQQQAPLMNSGDLICANLEDLDPYVATFEGGLRPIRVSYYVEPVVASGQVLILPPTPEEGPMSRVAMVTLPKDEVVKLCEDGFLLQFSPTVLNRTK